MDVNLPKPGPGFLIRLVMNLIGAHPVATAVCAMLLAALGGSIIAAETVNPPTKSVSEGLAEDYVPLPWEGTTSLALEGGQSFALPFEMSPAFPKRVPKGTRVTVLVTDPPWWDIRDPKVLAVTIYDEEGDSANTYIYDKHRKGHQFSSIVDGVFFVGFGVLLLGGMLRDFAKSRRNDKPSTKEPQTAEKPRPVKPRTDFTNAEKIQLSNLYDALRSVASHHGISIPYGRPVVDEDGLRQWAKTMHELREVISADLLRRSYSTVIATYLGIKPGYLDPDDPGSVAKRIREGWPPGT